MTKEKRAYRVVGHVAKNSREDSMSFELTIWDALDAADAVEKTRFELGADNRKIHIASVNPR